MFGSCLYFNALTLGRALEREWSKAFKLFALTPAQGFMLKVILNKPGLPPCEIAETLAITRPTTTRILDGLQKLKLIERKKTNQDGREFKIYPTAKAKALKDQINLIGNEVTKKLKNKLGIKLYENVVVHTKNARSILE